MKNKEDDKKEETLLEAQALSREEKSSEPAPVVAEDAPNAVPASTLRPTTEELPVPPRPPSEDLPPLDALMRLIPDEAKAKAAKLIAEVTGLVDKRKGEHPQGPAGAPPPALPSQAHLRQGDPNLAPKAKKPFVI